MNDLFSQIEQSVKSKQPTIVFPEGTDQRILEAASRLSIEEIIKPILIGNVSQIKSSAAEQGLSFKELIIFDPANYDEMEQMVEAFVERRNGKATAEEARQILQDVNYFGTMLVYLKIANGLLSGAAHSTADTVRPALQIIKTKEGIKRTSGAFLMVKGEEQYIFADCAININPEPSDLAEIAMMSADTAKIFGVDPRVALLSFSTKGSAKSPETEKVIGTAKILGERGVTFPFDGELQFDAAFVPEVANKKAPNSPLKGNANVFVFPSLEAGNIGYKMVQRLGGYEAIGPVLQGLRMPVNDLSRGCNAEDVYKLALITASQAIL